MNQLLKNTTRKYSHFAWYQYPIRCALFLLLSINCHASEFEDLLQIQNSVALFVERNIPIRHDEKIIVTVDKLSEQTQLPRCRTLPIISFPPGTEPENSSVVSVECLESPVWRIYVPFRYQLLSPVVVAKHKILTGETITPDDLKMKKVVKGYSSKNYYKNIDKVLSLSASRVITAGTPITRYNTKKIPLIKRNQPVTLQLRQGAIVVSMLGIAKSDGYLDERVQIINPSSKKVIDAITTGNGTAELRY